MLKFDFRTFEVLTTIPKSELLNFFGMLLLSAKEGVALLNLSKTTVNINFVLLTYFFLSAKEGHALFSLEETEYIRLVIA